MPVVSGPVDADGAVVEVHVGVSSERRKRLESVGLPVPARVRVRAQIDTGSDLTGFDFAVFSSLGIAPVGQIVVSTPSTRRGVPAKCDQYHVSLSLVHDREALELHWTGLLVIGSEYEPTEKIQGLLGRDILNSCLLVYDGERRTFSIAF